MIKKYLYVLKMTYSFSQMIKNSYLLSFPLEFNFNSLQRVEKMV